MPTFRYVNYYDSFDGYHPNVFVPRHYAPPTFDSIEEICNYLLGHKEVHRLHSRRAGRRQGGLPHVRRRDRAARTRKRGSRSRSRPRRCAPGSTRRSRRPGSPTRPACRACRTCSVAPTPTRSCSSSRSAPASARTSSCRRRTATPARRRSSSPRAADWDEHADELVGQQLKVMKRIDCREAAIEGVITRHGTLVGPLMTELTGFPSSRPYGGGWCGNDVFATALTERHRQLAREYTQRMGDRLARGGLPRLLRARLPRRHATRASCTSASSTRASPERAR